MRARILLPILTVLVVAGCGSDDTDHADHGGDTPAGMADARTIEVKMVDIAFEPTEVDAEAGETIRFEFTNEGAIAHDAFIGDAAAQAQHHVEMGDEAEGGHLGGHGDGDAITVEPGGTGELEYTFEEPGEYQIGCHQPGHYDAGMIVTVNVA